MKRRNQLDENRRSFLSRSAGMLVSAVAAPLVLTSSRTAAASIVLGEGRHRYEWITGWAKLPDGMAFGNTHGAVVIDRQGRVLMNSDTENAVIIFDPNGKFIKAWGKEWKGGSHGMALHREGRNEFVYLTHHSRHEFAKFTLDGEVVWIKGYPQDSKVYQKADEFRPTGVAVAPNGDFYVTDGYGKSWVHQYNAKGDYVRSWGGLGAEPGKLKQPHGIWIDGREKTPRVLVADRANHRLQWFSLNGEYLSMLDEGLRLPSNFHELGKDIVIADLQGRVTIIDGQNKIVTHLGDNTDPEKRGKNPIPREQWADGQFISPHCPRWDSQGNLYVAEWLSTGRITKLKRL
ncbi:MAG: hypothetical protein ABI882_01030 [Acidobacteriota bacterium]